MNTEISLSTFPGATVKAQYDAIANSTSISSSGVFAGGVVTITKGYILHIAQAYGMIKGRFFKLAETEKSVPLASGSTTLKGCLYIHMDLSNADDPIKLVVFTGETLPVLVQDENVNYNNSTYDVMMSTFDVSNLEVSNLVNKDITIKPVGDGAGTISRVTSYAVGQYGLNKKTPGWVTMCCTTAGTTASVEPSGYSTVTKIGDTVTDGTAVFTVRNLFGELDTAKTDITSIKTQIGSSEGVTLQVISLADYRALGSYGANTVYIVYEGSDTSNVTRIYIGEHATYTAGADVTYHIDTNTSETKHLNYGADALASAPTATKTGYTFLGWRADSQARSGVLTTKIIDDETAVDLYAVFSKSTGTMTITFDANGGAGTVPEPITATGSNYNNGSTMCSAITLPACSLTLDGKTFIGWSVNDSGDYYKPGELVSTNATVYATWYSTSTAFTADTVFTIPQSGIYKINLVSGGHVSGYKKFNKGTKLYVYPKCAANVTLRAGTIACDAFTGSEYIHYSELKNVLAIAGQSGSSTLSDSGHDGQGGGETGSDSRGSYGSDYSGGLRETNYSSPGDHFGMLSHTSSGVQYTVDIGRGYMCGECSFSGASATYGGGGSGYNGGLSQYIDGVKYDLVNERGNTTTDTTTFIAISSIL